MNCFRYKMDHDYGFAPNPYHGIMSLATCKSGIRNCSNLQVGDWIIGLGSVAMGNLHHLVYAMKLEEKLTFDQYWNDSRFECKKPILNGSLIQMYGDNVYHTDVVTGKVIQENCAHSMPDGSANAGHYTRDVNGKYVLLSKTFYYFGDSAPLIPNKFSYIYDVARSLKYKDLVDKDAEIRNFIDWIAENYELGIHGDPITWRVYNLPEMDVYEDKQN